MTLLILIILLCLLKKIIKWNKGLIFHHIKFMRKSQKRHNTIFKSEEKYIFFWKLWNTLRFLFMFIFILFLLLLVFLPFSHFLESRKNIMMRSKKIKNRKNRINKKRKNNDLLYVFNLFIYFLQNNCYFFWFFFYKLNWNYIKKHWYKIILF